MIDPRYENVEVYFGSAYGLALRQILAIRHSVTEQLLPGLQIPLSELFKPSPV